MVDAPFEQFTIGVNGDTIVTIRCPGCNFDYYSMRKKNVLVIGSGNRVQKTTFPALVCLRPIYTISAVYSRHKKTIRLPGNGLTIRTETDIHAINLAKIDIIIVAITPQEVGGVLLLLSKFSVSHCVLFLDTPVLPINDFLAIRFFSCFKAVHVSEDYQSMLIFDVMAHLIREGHIGRLRYVYLFHSGYKYHALATIKKIASCNSVSFMRRFYISEDISSVHIRLANGVQATVIEPRDYSIGKFLVVGEHGAIADYPLSGMSTIHIGYRYKYGVFSGIDVRGAITRTYKADKRYDEHIASGHMDNSLINCQKIEGLIRMYQAARKTSSPYLYTWDNGMYDSVASFFLDTFGWFIDTKLPFTNTSIVQGGIQMVRKMSELFL